MEILSNLRGKGIVKKSCYIYVTVGLFLTIVILVIFALTSAKTNIKKKEEQCRSIYTEIQEEAFHTGKWTDNTLLLYDNNFREIEQLSVKYNSGKEPVKIVNEFNQIRFVLGGAVDDEYGVIFVKGTTLNMSGIYLAKRLSGNSYYYETWE